MTKSTKSASLSTLVPVFENGVRYLSQYFFFTDPMYPVILTLWAMATCCFRAFDSFGTIVIMAALKRCGKSRLGRALGSMCRRFERFTSMTKATMFYVLDSFGEDGGTVIFDESEELASESHEMRPVLNESVYRGGYVPRVTKDGLKRFSVFGANIFVLIGDLFDTLRDRSIPIEMTRGTGEKVFHQVQAMQEGQAITQPLRNLFGDEEHDNVNTDLIALVSARAHEIIEETTDIDSRALDMWLPILTMASLVEQYGGRKNLLRDVTTFAKRLQRGKESTDKRTASELRKLETNQHQNEHSEALLRDIHAKTSKRGNMRTEDLLNELNAEAWGLFRGTGLTPHVMEMMLRPFNLGPKQVKIKGVNRRGYRADHVEAAFRKL